MRRLLSLATLHINIKTGCVLSFTTLHPSAAGGAVGFAPIAVMCIRSVLNEGITRSKRTLIELGIAAIAATAVGVAIGKVADLTGMFKKVCQTEK